MPDGFLFLEALLITVTALANNGMDLAAQ